MSEEELMKKMQDEMKKRGLWDKFIAGLKGTLDYIPERKKDFGPRKSKSMVDLNRDLEEDPRRVHTDPLDEDDKKKYEGIPNPFRNNCIDNCYAEPYKNERPKLDPSQLRIKIT